MKSRRTEQQQPIEDGTQNAVISKLLPLTNTRPPHKSLADVGESATSISSPKEIVVARQVRSGSRAQLLRDSLLLR
jgi:hypothetical protein